MKPKVMIVLGSGTDYTIAEKAMNIFEELKIPYDLKVASAHRTHEKVKNIVLDSVKNGVEVFIGIAGLSAHLPGIIAANTHRPVVGVPVDVKIGGLDALFACSQMPFPVPVATVGIDRGENGALFAAQILGTYNQKIRARIIKLREGYYEKVERDESHIITNIQGNYYSPIKITIPEPTWTAKEVADDSPLVSVIPGSYTDMKITKKVTTFLDRLGISYDLNVISPIRYPERFQEYIESMETVKLFIAISGLSAHVTGAVAALTDKPVIGVPCAFKAYGLDSLFSMVNMPPGAPVGTVGIGNGGNAAILAAEILGIKNEKIETKVKKLKGWTH
ncbi:MAG TPA: 5-(carboxyamino)imidazole ribonucleotide mutase [Methanothermobacter sp.]|jgi:5-(carboxyamino)imidazole ribonucleotide mutase|uniref:N5-carboxyaminoimidazole ribonucleotide mutase n=1 Tax=Methanothermobacter tenebrarum TaxID=680118 RepID=A0ABN6PEA3_9EURY|nr:5-(carboxyamino)imidazole ribonucleotide mutase [Methanothermobacter tenebrarum]MDD3454490.1 5-(carboxyamino)imidazole ribonucleotide mutase [Methanobacteriales archaeon]MDI6882705.1 5-(carboxyamino)imidazole ribonucleotide mutase [Methanothermobacter sp.]MDX9693630.1 5-(carboxyamino)imidazole ribonucleotide mutase [Methanothermobacter sp.]BDH80203.1 N5-carboxyaminoimidazole ribonucleotide mutase [Methanothermobacter tenebrarum]HHW16007.1 5-(carboxyamino)imidazole ribonucleotide mutase [Met